MVARTFLYSSAIETYLAFLERKECPWCFQYRLSSTPTALLKTLVLSSCYCSTVVLSGCASQTSGK